MKEEKMNYETPELEVLGVETQNCFASGGSVSAMSYQDVDDWDQQY